MALMTDSTSATALTPTVSPQTMMEEESRDAQIRATLYGQCIGDAIGLMTEFMTKDEAKEIYKGKDLEYSMKFVDAHRTRWDTGDWTDDSDQMLLILLSLVDTGGQVDVQDFARRMLGWMKSGFPELGDTIGHGLGQTTINVLMNPAFRTDPHQAAYEVWEKGGREMASNGGVMRTSVVGTHRWWNPASVEWTALQFVSCTHHDPRCQASAVAVSVCVSLMLQRQRRHRGRWGWRGYYDVDALIRDSFERAKQCLSTQEESEVLWRHMSCRRLAELKLGEPGKIGFTYKSMGAGFWALKKSNFRKAVQKIVMEGGDADTNACVAGALLGCKLGLQGIPLSWKAGLKHREWLDGVIDSWLALQKELAAQSAEPDDSNITQQNTEPDDSIIKRQQQNAEPEDSIIKRQQQNTESENSIKRQ